MQCVPTDLELLGAVRSFLKEDVLPKLEGDLAYNTRIATNLLAMLERSFSLDSEVISVETSGLQKILGSGVGKSCSELNRELSRGLRANTIDWRTDDVRDHMFHTVLDKIRVDNPNYSTYKEIFVIKNESR